MSVAVILRQIAVFLLFALVFYLGLVVGAWLVGLWPLLSGSTLVLIIAILVLLVAVAATILALPATIRFARCGLDHGGRFLTDIWPALSLLTLAAILLEIALTPKPIAVVDCLEDRAPAVEGSPSLVRDRKEVSTDLAFDYNRGETYGAQHEGKMDRYLSDLFGDYDEIEITRIVAHTDPIGSEVNNKALAQKRADYIRRAIERVAGNSSLAPRFKSVTLAPEIVVAEGASGTDYGFWRSCFDSFYIQKPADRPLENLAYPLNGSRKACSASTLEDGQDGNYPACRRLLPSDARRAGLAAFARRQENFRELTACLAPMRHVVVSFNRARLTPSAARPAPEVKCPKPASGPSS